MSGRSSRVTAICAPQDNFKQLAAIIGKATGIEMEIATSAIMMAERMTLEITQAE